MKHFEAALALFLITACGPESGAPTPGSAAPQPSGAAVVSASATSGGTDGPPIVTATVKLPPPPSGPPPALAPSAIPYLTASAAAPPAGFDYFVDASSVPVALRTKLGVQTGIRVLEIMVYPKYVVTQIQDPKKPVQVAAYTLREGVLAAPTPVKSIGKAKTEDELGKLTFDLGEVDWTFLSRMVVDAPRRLDFADGKVSHIIIGRPVPFEQEVRVKVFVKGPGGKGIVLYDLRGAMTKASE